MKDSIIISRDEKSNKLKVRWVYYGGIMVVGNVASKDIGVRSEDRKFVLQIFEKLKDITLDKEIEVLKRKRKKK
jgi:hypothetical protein